MRAVPPLRFAGLILLALGCLAVLQPFGQVWARLRYQRDADFARVEHAHNLREAEHQVLAQKLVRCTNSLSNAERGQREAHALALAACNFRASPHCLPTATDGPRAPRQCPHGSAGPGLPGQQPVSQFPPNAVVVHVVSHTHWDREWYLPFEVLRRKLLDVVDDVLAVVDYHKLECDACICPLSSKLSPPTRDWMFKDRRRLKAEQTALGSNETMC